MLRARPATWRATMGFDDWYRLSVHAVITDERGRVLLLKATYADRGWGLPGGAVDPGETIHQALLRECEEELGAVVAIRHLTGVYSHSAVRSHAFIFRCELPADAVVQLSDEHSELGYFDPIDLPDLQRRRVLDCLGFDGRVHSASF